MFKIGDEVYNNGTTSRYKGQYGVVYQNQEEPTDTVWVKYGNLNEGHPAKILQYKRERLTVQLPEDLFTL